MIFKVFKNKDFKIAVAAILVVLAAVLIRSDFALGYLKTISAQYNPLANVWAGIQNLRNEIKLFLDKLDLINGSSSSDSEKTIIEIENQASPLPLSQPVADYEAQVVKVVEKSNPSVVSVIVSKDLPVFEQYYVNPFEDFGIEVPPGFGVPQYRQKGTEKKEIGSGSGFIVSANGLIATNKHVVADPAADYTVIFNNGDQIPAEVIARDPDFDLAILEVKKNDLTPLPLGDSDKLKLGQTVVAIGNALGEFKNTVSVGVVSGLDRNLMVEGQNFKDLIQTDAAINRGNSGGPLLNLRSQVIGINTAMALSAENIGFAIPINQIKKIIEQVERTGSLEIAYLGVYYQIITPEIQKAKNLPVNYGALIVSDNNGNAGVIPDSPAEAAGLKQGDIILEINREKINPDQTLADLLRKYSPGDKVNLTTLRKDKEIIAEVVLGERE
ncbi:MAG: trypsin-like peptidase domain-containing protein [Patescibacteria group bacterium]